MNWNSINSKNLPGRLDPIFFLQLSRFPKKILIAVFASQSKHHLSWRWCFCCCSCCHCWCCSCWCCSCCCASIQFSHTRLASLMITTLSSVNQSTLIPMLKSKYFRMNIKLNKKRYRANTAIKACIHHSCWGLECSKNHCELCSYQCWPKIILRPFQVTDAEIRTLDNSTYCEDIWLLARILLLVTKSESFTQ